MRPLTPRLLPATLLLLAACSHPADPIPKGPQPTGDLGTFTATTTATWKPSSGRVLGNVAAASAGADAAVVYSESDPPDTQGVAQSHVFLQRLDTTGAVSGAPVALDTVELPSGRRPVLTVASAEGRYLACWERDGEIACAGAKAPFGSVSPAVSMAGTSPSLAHGSGSFVLAYGVDDDVAVIRLDGDGNPLDGAVSITSGAGARPMMHLAAMDSGFALVEGDKEGSSNVHVHRLDGDLGSIADPTDLGAPFWFTAAVAAGGADVVVGLAKPYGGTLFVVDGAGGARSNGFSAGGKTGMNVALLAGDAAFDMVSTFNADFGASGDGLRYRTVAEGALREAAEPILSDRNFESSALAMLRISGDPFVVAADGLSTGEMLIARIHRP